MKCIESQSKDNEKDNPDYTDNHDNDSIEHSLNIRHSNEDNMIGNNNDMREEYDVLDNNNDSYIVGFLTSILMVVAILLVIINIVELQSTINKGFMTYDISSEIYHQCYKWPYIAQIAYGIISTIAAMSCLVFAFIITFTDNGLMNITDTFTHINYLIFGPYLLCLTIIAFYHWDKIAFKCQDNTNPSSTILSYKTMASIIMLFLLSAFTTIFSVFISLGSFFIDSVTGKPEGSHVLRKVFWWLVINDKDPIDFIRNTNRNPQ